MCRIGESFVLVSSRVPSPKFILTTPYITSWSRMNSRGVIKISSSTRVWSGRSRSTVTAVSLVSEGLVSASVLLVVIGMSSVVVVFCSGAGSSSGVVARPAVPGVAACVIQDWPFHCMVSFDVLSPAGQLSDAARVYIVLPLLSLRVSTSPLFPSAPV